MPKPNDNNAMTKQRLAFPVRLFDEGGSRFAEPPAEIHIVPTGKWDHPVYGEMEITPKEITKFVQNFKAKLRRDIPITAGHDNGMSGGELPAIGWMVELTDRGVNGLWATVEWTPEGEELIRKKSFKYFSPEFYQLYEDPQTRKKHEWVLVGGALTNSPYFKELEAVVSFSEPTIINQFSDNSMNLETILAKDPSEITDEERAFLVENAADMSDDDKAKFEIEAADEAGAEGDEAGDESDDAEADADDAEGEADDAADDGEEAGEEEGADDAGADEEPVEASDKKIVQISASELAALRSTANKVDTIEKQLRFAEIEKKASKLMFSASNKAGRFLPKQKNALQSFMESLTDTQVDQFQNLVNNSRSAAVFDDEIGDAGSDEASAMARVDKAVKAAMSEFKLDYSEALRKVFKENPTLEAEYEAEIA